jgi:hypothetical protein
MRAFVLAIGAGTKNHLRESDILEEETVTKIWQNKVQHGRSA